MPNLVITNDIQSIGRINEDDAIVKPISTGLVMHGNTKEFVQTNKFDSSIENISLRYSPAYFQDFINKDYEVRITFVGCQAFPVKILSENEVDWRKPNNTVKYEKCDIPNIIFDKCVLFMNKSNMQFGCFDFIIKSDKWFFLEMNANGQWAWLEFATGLEISNAIVGFLSND